MDAEDIPFGRLSSEGVLRHSMRLAKRLELIKPSPTLMVTVKVAALRREGITVIDFGGRRARFRYPRSY